MSGGKLCDLGDGDLITIQWSGELRLVAVQVTADGVALRDLTDMERQAIEEEYDSVWASLDDLLKIHGHPEYGTRLVWMDA